MGETIKENLKSLLDEGNKITYHRPTIIANHTIPDVAGEEAFKKWKLKVEVFAKRCLTQHELYPNLLTSLSTCRSTKTVCNILSVIYDDLD